MAEAIWKSRTKRVPLSEINDDLSRFLREAENEDMVITRDRKLAGVLVGFGSEDDGSIIGSKTTRAFRAASNVRGRACGQGAASESKMSSESAEQEALSKLSS